MSEPRPAAVSDFLAKVPDWAILLVFCLIFSLQVIVSARQKSATFDEPVNLASGYVALRAGDYRIMPQNLPLVKLLAAIPLLFVNVRMPTPPPEWDDTARFLFGHRFLYEFNDADRLLILGRLAVLPLALLLGCFVYRWARQLFGKSAALFAVFLFTFEPNLLAHAGLVTTDVALACWMFVVIYGLSRVAQQVSPANLLLPALALGLSLLTKPTALLLVPIVLSLVLAVGLSGQPMKIRMPGLPRGVVTGRGRKLLTLLLVLLVWGLVAWGVIWGAYRFSFEGSVTPDYAFPRPWSQILPQRPFAQGALLWARGAKLLPEAYLYGFFYLFAKSRAFIAFLMGNTQYGSWWYYFLVTFLIKTPVALVLLVILAVGVHARRWREAPVQAAFLLLPVLVYFGLISASGWNIGHRHLLPIYPFLFVLVGGLLPWARQKRRWVQGAVAGLAAWYLAAALWIAPHYLAYFNELVGGPAQGYRYLVDSNLDWGQDIKGLKRYMDAQGIERVWLSYFGQASPEYYGIRYNYLPSYILFDPKHEDEPTPFVAISATNLQGVYLPGGLGVDPDFFQAFRERQPIANIGYSIFVYRLK